MFYAVKIGKKPGIYNTWDECKENVNGFKGAKFHKFKTLDEANMYMNEDQYSLNNHNDGQIAKLPYAFVDGSYNPSTKVYGYGGIVKYMNEEDSKIETIEITGNGNDPDLCIMRNITGELLGAIESIKQAIALNLKEINIYYDYLGIEMWANKQWNTNKNFIKDYIKFVEESRKLININFYKVAAHTGIEGNEIADSLAKKAVGLI